MTITQIENYYRVVQCGSYTIAANQLFTTQPALSKSIMALENELGIKLINRTTRQLTLTAAGESFASTCAELLQTYNHGVANAKKLGGLAPALTIGLLAEAYNKTAIEFIIELKQLYPTNNIQVNYYNAMGLLSALDDNDADFVIAAGWPKSGKLKSQFFRRTRNYAVLSASHSLAHKQILEFKHLRNESFIVPDHMLSGDQLTIVRNLAAQNHFTAHIIRETKTVHEALSRIALNEGISILPSIYMDIAGSGVVFVPLREATFCDEHLLWRDDDNPWVKSVTAVAKNYIQYDDDSYPEL